MFEPLTDGTELAVAFQKLELHPPPSAEGLNENEKQVSTLGEPLEAVKKRAPSLLDKKLNPEFFQKRATEIEVAVPQNSPPSTSPEPETKLFEHGKELNNVRQNEEELYNGPCFMREKGNEASNWQYIHDRLLQFEQQQSTLMQMVQVSEQLLVMYRLSVLGPFE